MANLLIFGKTYILNGQKYIPYKGQNLDLAQELMSPDLCRFIKNLVYSFGDSSIAGIDQGGQSGSFKPLMANQAYVEDFVLPDNPEDNTYAGEYSSKEMRQVFVCVHNAKGNHTVYRINGLTQTIDIVYQKSTLNFQLKPEYFIHDGGAWLEIINLTDPATGETKKRTFLFLADGFNPPRQICIEDSIATSGFDATLFPYFAGDYDPMILINMGVPTPSDCIGISEVAVTPSSIAVNNALLFNTWQFRLRYLDVWGRPSEYGIISDMYIPGTGCIASSSALPNCLDLIFDAPPPHINQVEVAFRKCNDQQWYISDTLDLYNGSPLGEWWLRTRNTKINFNNNKITYRFCAKTGCDPISPALTNRLENPMPQISQSVSKIGKYIGLSNNKYGFLPFTQELKDKIQVTVEPPSDQTAAVNSLRNIDILVQVYNPFINKQGGIFLKNGKYWFGAFGDAVGTNIFGIPNSNLTDEYEQFFANADQKGFGGYLAGTNNFVISEQWTLDATGKLEKSTDYQRFDGSKLYFQRFRFTNVPKGKYIFRIFSNQVDPVTLSIAECVKTSTYVTGTYASSYSTPSNPINNNNLVSQAKELLVDVCSSDYETIKDNKTLVVWDFSHDKGVAVEAGYVYNTNQVSQSQIGVELLRVDAGAAAFKSNYTDHNGYYFVASKTNRFRFQIFGYCNCSLIQLVDGRAGNSNKLWQDNFFLNSISSCKNWENQLCVATVIKGRVLQCGTNIGVPNISVVLSRGKYGLTDANGDFEIIAFDDTINTTRTDTIYYVTNSCNFTNCDGNCVDPIQVVINKCVTCDARQMIVADRFIAYKTERGLLTGGTYPIGMVGKDWLGRETFIQPLKDVNIPSVQETKTFAPSKLHVQILPGAVFPVGTKEISFWYGPESTMQDYITWIVDFVQFIDNTGKENNLAPTQIKIFYSSLSEYNKENNFNTTTNWQFLAPLVGTETTQSAFTADQVQFMINGDGEFFSKAISALVKYDQAGQFFLIDYTSDLKDLQQNAIIRLVRPKSCTNNEGYYEVCSTIKIVNRKAQVTDFFLNAFDTYYLNRQIPVPTPVPNTDPVEFVNEGRIFGVPFEHDSPSDFWGKGCHNIGRFSVKNPQETVVYKQDEIALSGGLSDTGLLNFLNFFEDSDSKKINFDDTALNGIVSVLPQTSIVLFIGQSDFFVVGYGDNMARANSDGTIQVASVDGFGKPQRKLEDNYGCLLKDKNTIASYEGKVCWLDTVKAIAIHNNYQDAIPLSKDGADSYLRPKIKFVQQYNLLNDNKRYFHGIINPINFEYIVTDFIIGSGSYINNLWRYMVSVPETIAFDILSKGFKATYSFTPEGYSALEGEKNNSQLFSYKNAIPYRHYTTEATKFNTFYGIKVSRVLRIVASGEVLKKKKMLSSSVYCKQSKYYIAEAKTETGQISRVLLYYFAQAEYGTYAPLLCDLNTPFDPNRPVETGVNVLLDGDLLYGTWIEILFVGDPSKDDEFSELQGVVINSFPSPPSGVNQ